MPHATVPSPGLQALILCGPGESLSTFTSNPSDFSKALIPIANRPMVWYPLDWCYRMGIHDITLVTPAESKSALEAALKTVPALTNLPNPKPDILAPKALTQTTGTGELLRLPEVQSAITSDFVVLPCDLVSELDGTKLVQQWMTLNPSSISTPGAKRKGGLGLFYPTQGLEGISLKKDETDFIATVPLPMSSVPAPAGSLRPDVERLVLSMPTDTVQDKVEEAKEILKVRLSLVDKYGNLKLKTKHRDAHVYILPKWVKDYAARNDKFDSISEDVMGWWAKSQWQQGLGEKLAMDEALGHGQSSEQNLADSVHLEKAGLDIDSLSSTKSTLAVQSSTAKTTSFASRVGSTKNLSIPAEPLTVPPLMAYIQPSSASTTPTPEHPLIRRVDNSGALLSISLYLAKQPASHALAHENKVHPTATIGHQSRVAQEDSLIGENAIIGTRSIVKESVVGPNCEIGNNVRLTKCLLMDGVTIGDGVQLTGCIIGRRARIQGMKAVPTVESQPAAEGAEGKKAKKAAAAEAEDRTRLTECEVAPHFVVEAGTEAKGETFSAFDTADLSGDDFADVGEDDDDGE